MDSVYPTLSPVGVDFFLVTDSQGKIAYQASAPEGGAGPFKPWGLEEALSGETILETGYGPQGWAIRAMAPLSRGGKQYGVLILGIRLGDAFARKIGEDTQTHISFSTPYQILASSWPPAQRRHVELPWVIRSVHEKRSFFHLDKGGNTSSFYVPLEIGDETVCLVVNTDATPIYNLLEQKKKHLFLSFFGVLVVILGIGSGLTFSIVSPLRALQQRALAVIRDFSQKDLPMTPGGNEIGTLSQAMEVMLAAIQAHLTEIESARKALEERETFLARVFASIQDGITVMDRDFTILRVNPTVEQKFPHAAPLVGRKCYAAFHGAGEPCEECPSLQAMEAGRSGYQSKEIMVGERTEWVDIFAFPLQDPVTGRVTGVIEYIREITDRKRAEEALQEARRDWEEIFQAIGQPTFLLDPEQKIIAANRAAQAALGGQAAEILGRKCYELLHHRRDDPAPGCPMEKLLDSGRVETMEMEVEALEGTYLVSCTPVFDAQGKLQKVIHIATDITARKQAEEALSKSHRELQETAQRLEQSMNMLQLILESIPVRVFWKDKDLRYLGCNTLFARDAGLSRPEQLLGLDDFAMGWREQAELYRADDRRVMESGLSKMNIIEPQTTPEGGKILLNTSKVPLQMPNGEVFGVLGVYEDITARKRAEEALAEEAIRRRILVEQSRDGIVVLDQTGKVYEANQRYAEMLGYSAEEVRQLHVWDWDAQWTREELLEQIRRVDDAGDHFETRHRRRDGTIFDVEISSNGVVLGGQKLVFCVCRDISQRKAAAQALRESEEKYRLLVNQIPAVVFRGYADWSMDTFDDQKIEKLTGYPREDFDTRRRKWSDLILAEDLPQAKGKFLEGLKTIGTYEREYRIRKRSGEIIWVQVQGRIFLDAAGRIDYISGVIFDVTARKKAEEALLKYEFIANTAKDCMTLIDRNYLYEAANAAYCRNHGKTWDEVVGQSVAKVWGQKTFDYSIKAYLDQCFSGRAVEFEGWFAFGNRGLGCYHVSYNPYFNEDGTVAYAAVVSHDITARKQAEEELRKERDLSLSIMESLPGVFYLMDEQGRMMRWNKNLEEISRYASLEILTMAPEDFFAKKDKPRLREAMHTALTTGEARLEAELVSKDGIMTPYLFTGRRIFMEKRPFPEQRPFIVGMGLDISVQRQMEEALKKRLVALSRPLDDARDINFDDLFNLEDIQRIQDLFVKITGVASIITTPEGTPITQPSNFCRLCGSFIRQTEQGRKRCAASDSHLGRYSPDGPIIQHCLSAGLCGAGASITVGGKHIASWLIGQVRDGSENEESLRSYARDLGADEEDFIAAFREVPVMSKDQFEQVAQALFVFANQLSTMAYQNVQQARFITERRKAEEVIRERESMLSLVINTVPQVIFWKDLNSVYLGCNQNYALAAGLETPAAIVGKTEYDLPWRLEETETYLAQDREVMQTKQAKYHQVETRKLADGREIWVDGTKIPMLAADATVIGVLGVYDDITARKRMEEEAEQLEAAILESERRFRGLVENVPMGIMIVQDGQIVYQNPEQKRLFGHLRIQNCHDFVRCGYPDDLAKVQQFCKGTMANKSQADITLRFLPLGTNPQEARPIWVNCRAAVIEYRGQKAVLINMVDITRTKELEHLMLHREKMASLGQVAAGIAHEIRNPLSGINVFLDGIKENFQDPENAAIVQELIAAAQATSNRIEGVIRRVLDFSRPAELRLAPIDVNLAVDNAIKLAATSLRKESIKIDGDLAAGLPLVKADMQLLEQVLVNMITNAGEALRETGEPGRIQISTQRTNEGVLIAVNDSGPGIPPEIRDKIFDPFFTTKSDGSGIGLSLCHRIITDHGGTIEVSASDLGGTQFMIHLFGN